MSNNLKKSIGENYYSGGFAELVSSPSYLTYSFFADWFTGLKSVGKAMRILGIPCQKSTLPILVLKGHELLVDLIAEENTLYQNTIFTYKKQSSIYDIPKLAIDFIKIVNPFCMFNTFKILLTQSQWIAKPERTVTMVTKLIEDIPEDLKPKTLQEVDELLQNTVFPSVLAVGILSEFYNQLILKETAKKHSNVNAYISRRIAKDDWFFRSISDQIKVKQEKISFSDYIEKYGIRSDKDYELISPRWYEIQDVIKKRIDSTDARLSTPSIQDLKLEEHLQKMADVSVELQVLRNEAKRKTLIYIDILRKTIIELVGVDKDIGVFARKDLLAGKVSHRPEIYKVQTQKEIGMQAVLSGRGVSVSQGFAKGTVANITNNEMYIQKETIGIFPNASPEFANQYSKCIGMIFLKGGQTSHGSIVAREFGIPAIIDSKAQRIADNLEIELNATKGEWKIV